jgi:uncharacterized membrane protein
VTGAPRRRNPLRLLGRALVLRRRMAMAMGLAVLVAVLAPANWEAIGRALAGWNTFVYTYLALVWTMMVRADQQQLRRVVPAMDETAAMVLALVVAGAVMSVLAIVAELATAGELTRTERLFHLALTGLTVLGSWTLVPTAFTLHYAYMYYRLPDEVPLQFPEGEAARPDYADFLYFAFTIAVASQTADVTVRTRAMRRLVLFQSILSFFFNASVVAMAVNIAASLAFPSR